MKDAVMVRPPFPGLSAYGADLQFTPRDISANSTPPRPQRDVARDFPAPGTPAWGHFNRRRAKLIRQRVRNGLSPSEEEELEWLQRETLAAVDRAYPRPPARLAELAELERRLQERSGSETP
jgi:hypothetical protein